jgi:predicted DNA-binding ribbon-helix-helix protein
MARKKEGHKAVTVYLPEDLWQFLAHLSIVEKLSVSRLVVRVCEDRRRQLQLFEVKK